MGYHIIRDNVDIKLYKASAIITIGGSFYTPYCAPTKVGLFSGTGRPVLFIGTGNGKIIIDKDLADCIYKTVSNGFFSSEMVKVEPDETRIVDVTD
jgi:hypothetical protein